MKRPVRPPSGDQDLLSLAEVFACPIVNAEQFMETLEK